MIWNDILGGITMNKYDEKKTMSVREFAEEYGVGINNAYQLVNAYDFPKIKFGRKILIIKSKVDSWLEEQIGNSF